MVGFGTAKSTIILTKSYTAFSRINFSSLLFALSGQKKKMILLARQTLQMALRSMCSFLLFLLLCPLRPRCRLVNSMGLPILYINELVKLFVSPRGNLSI